MKKTVSAPSVGQPAPQTFETAVENSQRERRETNNALFDLGRFVGVAQAASAFGNFCAASQIRVFEEVKKSKTYVNVDVKHPDGELRPAQNIDEFCRLVFGRGYRVMQENAQAMERLGEESFEAVRNIGVSRTEMRLLIAMPEDEREMLQEAVSGDDKGEIASVIHDLVDKLQKERAKTEDLKASMEAKNAVIRDKNLLIDSLKEEERKKAQPRPTEEALADLDAALLGIEKAVINLQSRIGFVRKAIGDGPRLTAITHGALERGLGAFRQAAYDLDIPLPLADSVDMPLTGDEASRQWFAALNAEDENDPAE